MASFHAWTRRRGCSLFLSRESRCHLSELEYRRIGGLFSQPVAAPATPAERTALIYSGTNPAVILSTSTMLQRLRDSAARRSVIAGKGMTPARLFFGLLGHFIAWNRALSEVALFVSLSAPIRMVSLGGTNSQMLILELICLCVLIIRLVLRMPGMSVININFSRSTL